MAKKKPHPTAPHPNQPQQGQDDALLEATHPGNEGVVPNPPAPEEAQAVADPNQVNIVDTPGTSIVICGDGQDVLDATVEEPTYPAQEWQQPATGMVLPSEGMTDESLVALILGRQGAISFRLKRDIEDYWVIGSSLNILYRRHAVEKSGTDGKVIPSKWRSEWLPKLGINHTSDQQLRVFAEKFSLDEVGQFGSKTEALRACGFSIGGVTKAIEHQRSGAGQGGAHSGQAEPIEADVVADAAAQPQADLVAGKKVEGKPQPTKIAAKVAPKPAGGDPIVEDEAFAEAEALVVTLAGAPIVDMEAAAIGVGLTTIARTEKRVVGLLWYAEDDFQPAQQKVAKAIEKLRSVKKNLQVEARYLLPSDVIAV